MTAATSEGILAGVASITAKDLGRKVGLSLLSNLLTEPVEFFLKQGLEALFNSHEDEQFQKVFEMLDQLQHEIDVAMGKLSLAVQESQLEEEHANIATYYSNLRTAVNSASTVQDAYQTAYHSFFSQNTVEILDQFNRDTQQIRDRLIGDASISQGYLEVLSNNLYTSNANIYTFTDRLKTTGILYLQDLVHAALVLSCLHLYASNSLQKTKASELISSIGDYSSQISSKISNIMRDMETVRNGLAKKAVLLRNKETQRCLGRYCEPHHQSRSIITHFELITKGEGYFYLKVPNHDVGIDHYHGKDIRPVYKSDSNHPNHLWRFDPCPSNPQRFVRIVNQATEQCLDHYYGRSIKGAPKDEHPNHLWELVPAKEGSSLCIVNKATGALLGYNLSHHRFDGFNAHYLPDVGAYNPSFGPSQCWKNLQWKFQRYNESIDHNLCNEVTGEAVDHYDGKSFRFVKAPSANTYHLWQIEPSEIGDNKAYCFIRNHGSQQVLDHYDGKELRGAGDRSAKSPHPNHIWEFEY